MVCFPEKRIASCSPLVLCVWSFIVLVPTLMLYKQAELYAHTYASMQTRVVNTVFLQIGFWFLKTDLKPVFGLTGLHKN